MTPKTLTGIVLWDKIAPLPPEDAPELIRRAHMGRRNLYQVAIAAVEREAVENFIKEWQDAPDATTTEAPRSEASVVSEATP